MEGRMWQGKGEQKDGGMDGGKAVEEDVCDCHFACLMAPSQNLPAGKIRET